MRINEQIEEREVRLIDQEGNHVGVVPLREALTRARAVGLDLVTINSSNAPHICRIMDFGQFKYEQAKKRREARKKSATISVKEVKLRPKIDEHDYQFKLRNALRFLAEGDKVKITIMFRGREITHTELGRKVLDRMQEDLSAHGAPEGRPSFEGRTIVAVFSPLKGKKPAVKTEEPKEASAV
ncbi:translation initiation factor IF-3 [bacterium]|nr:translation initiation factor IF-3 [bacterium]